jgi:tetratricopeptide (TPR) repeat protein
MESIFDAFLILLSSAVIPGLVIGLVLIVMTIIKKIIEPYFPKIYKYYDTTKEGKMIFNFLTILLVIVCAIILYKLYIFLLPFDYIRFVTVLIFILMIVGGIIEAINNHIKKKKKPQMETNSYALLKFKKHANNCYKMQNTNSLFNEAFYLSNSSDIENNDEDYYSLIHSNPNFNKDRRFAFKANIEDYKKAIDLFEQFIAIRPNCKYAYNYCGTAKKCIKDYQGAILDCTKAIAIDQNYEIAHFNRGLFRFILNEYEEAIKDTTTAISLNENYGSFYEIRGSAKSKLKDFTGAIEDFTKCIELEPNNIRAYALRGDANRRLYFFEKSIVDFTKVYELDPPNFNLYSLRGYAYFKLKKYKNAIKDFKKAIEINPETLVSQKMLKESEYKLFEEERIILDAKMPSKKPLIIKAFSEMNISLLEVLLNDQRTYQNATKETFLEKMNVVFEQFKQLEDTTLLPYVGKCNSDSCNNKGCTGFTFIGNHSNSFVDLVFDETENDFKDIYCCCNMKAKDAEVKKNNKFSFEMGLDEKATYLPSPSEAKAIQDCKNAYDEIVKSKTQVQTKEFLINWLGRNRKLYDYIEDDGNELVTFVYSSIDNFRNLFSNIESSIKYINHKIPAFNALEEYQKLDISIEPIILKWLVVNEELYNGVNKSSFKIDSDGRLKINYPELLFEQKFLEGNYTIMTQFKVTYQKHYWSMITKYQVLDDEVPAEMSTDSEEYKKYYSLKYQLVKRGIQV